MGGIKLGRGTTIHPSARINVTERLVIGDHGTVHEGCVIEGRDIEIGHELWMLPGAIIGGGSRYEQQSELRAGHFLHLGRDSFINTARPVHLGNEVGLGTRTALFTHGAYLSALDGFPVAFGPITVGDNVWLPGATVNPDVSIGDNVVVAVGSVVISDIPSGSLAAGAPAKVIRENAYPRPLSDKALDTFWQRFLHDIQEMGVDTEGITVHKRRLIVGGSTIFDTEAKTILGVATDATERMRDLLRRYGIRFYSRPTWRTYTEEGEYEGW